MELSVLLLAFASLFASIDCRSEMVQLPSSRCDKVYRVMVEIFDMFKNGPKHYVYTYLNKTFNLENANENALRDLACKLADVETVTELCEWAHVDQSLCQRVRRYYQHFQELFASEGGYTNKRRRFQAYYDYHDLLLKYTRDVKNATTVRDVIDLPTLIQFFEVMQVKYGSRWLSIVTRVQNEKILITDPEKFATDMYESNTAEEFGNKQSIPTELGPDYTYPLRETWYTFTANHKEKARLLRMHSDFSMAEFVELTGKLGFLTLKY